MRPHRKTRRPLHRSRRYRTRPPPPCQGKWPSAGLLFLSAGIGACAGPALVPDVPGMAGPILQEVPGLRVAVEIGAWNARPSGLTDTVLPLLVTLRNTGTRPVTVARQDFALLDQANRQYLPIPSADVAAMYGGGSGSGVGISPSVGFGGSSGGRSFFGGGSGSDLRFLGERHAGHHPVGPGGGTDPARRGGPRLPILPPPRSGNTGPPPGRRPPGSARDAAPGVPLPPRRVTPRASGEDPAVGGRPRLACRPFRFTYVPPM